MSPDDYSQRINAFQKLFSLKQNSELGWKVGETCRLIHKDNERHYFVSINVDEGMSRTQVQIFE